MCKMPSKYVKQWCRNNIDEKYSMNTSIITKKRFLRYVKGYLQSTDTPVWPSPHRSLCPRVNMYYAFNEDTNPFTRISEFTETTCTCSYDVNTSPHFEPPLDPFADRDPYSEDEARRKYLDTKPVCFVIFGKPGLNSRKLAKMIADSWNCVLISPETLVRYEIERKTEKGRWIEQVLQAGRDIGAEVIMNLIECRVNQRDVLHRGYIIEGLPLIPNNPDLDYSHYPHEWMGETEHNSIVSNSESSIYLENEEIKPKVSPKTREEVNDEKREDSTSEQSFVSMRSESYNLTANPFKTDFVKMILRDSYERDIERQIEEIFNIWPIKPQVIIYMICPDQDVISKRYQFRLDPHSGNIVDIGLLEIKEELYTLFSHTMIAPNIDIPIELYQEIMIEQKLVDKDFKKHLLRRVSDMRPNVEIQCNIYERYALPCIEKQVLKHNPQYVIRVDGRTAVTHMFQIVQVKLRTLPLPRVILPKEVLNSVETFQEGEESSVGTPDNNFESKTNEEVFQELASKGIVSSRFPWRMSRWNFLCPVALAKGQTIGGNFKYTVSFMNKLFFLSSLEAMEMFMQNPRPFLLPPNPRPTCKIAVFGPKYSGKSKLSYDLTRVVGGTVIDIQSIENKLIENHLESNITAAVHDILDELNEKVKTEREERETARLSALQSWYMDVKNLVNQLTYVLRQENVIEEKSLVTDSNELKAIRKKLKEYNIEFIETDKNLRERINKDDTVLLEFAPDYLQNEEPPVRELTDHDPEFIVVLKNRMAHIRHTSLNVTAEERATMLIETIKMVPNEPIGDGLFREGGWILDGMYTNPEIWTRIMEAGIVVDDLIIIHDEAPYDYLLKKWHLYKFKQKVVNFESEEENREEDDHLSIVNITDSAEDMEFEGESIEIDIETVAIENYIDDIKQFETNFENFQQTFTEVREKIITCNLKAEENIVENIVKCMNERYRLGASIMTNEEKERETEDIDAMETIEPEDTLEEDEDEEEIVKQTVSKDNRRLGETGPYCPVALSRHNVLWKGKEQFGALFLDKMYLLSSEKALEDFIRDPYEFITYDKPLKLIPPLRISVVGPSGSGKTTLARTLSKENGLAHVDFLGCLDMYMKERGIPLVGCKHEEDVFSFDADDPSKSISEKMELPEDLEDQQYNIDKTTIQTFVRKYLKEGAMLPKRMLQECLLNYFRVPYNKCGIILDSFPNCTYDVEAALDNFAVPEIVIELQCSCDKVLERMVPVLFDSWSTKQSERKVQEENRYAEEFEIFMERKEKWIEKGLRERRQQRTSQSVFEETVDTEENTKDDEENTDADLSRQTLISEESWDFEFEELNEEQAMIDRMELEDLWRKEFPEPIKFEDWEDPEAAKQRISREVQLAYEVNGKNLLSIRTMLEEESITWKVVNAEGKESSVLFAVLKILDPFIFRNSSMLERTYEVDVETAERLLDCGYYFLSSFGRYCPVQIYEGKIPFQMFLPMEALRQVYPVLHRQYVYFIAGEERLSAFLKHPLKYLEQDSCVPLIPAHISIIGPPKCGKSTLAKRFATTYGMKLITRGHSLRHILKNFAWTELSRLTETHLRGGHVSPEESIARAVELFSMDPRSASQGYILDGFPANRPEAEELAFLGIRPMIVVDLKADLNFCLQCLANETERLKKPPCFSPCYLSHQYEDWQIEGRTFRDWLTKFAQNVVELDGTVRKWAVWTRANDEVCFRFARIKKYFREADYDKVHSLAYMCVSPYEFRQRQSQFESFCPVCLRHEGSMNFSGPPPDHQARRVPVPDARFDYLCEYFKPVSKVPGFLNVVDIAGLVKGAAEGQGLGNAFLSHISACDGIFHLCRAFEDDDVTHIEGDVNPVRDFGIIGEELRLKDIEFLTGHLEKLEKLVVRGNDKKLKPEYDTLLKVKSVLVDEKNHIRFADWSVNDIEVLNKYLFLTSKPVIYLVNLSEKDYIRKKNKWLIKIKEWIDKNDPGAILIPFSGAFENKIIDMEPEERAKYLEENKVTSALDKIIVQGYKALQLQYFFTAGHDEVKAWTIQKGTKAPQAAGRIHTDFEKGFITAEVMKFDDFKNEGSEASVKAAGKYRQQGRNYVVEDGDIIFFKFNAGAGLKDAKKK